MDYDKKQKILQKIDYFWQKTKEFTRIMLIWHYIKTYVFPPTKEFIWWKANVLINGSILMIPVWIFFGLSVGYWNIFALGICLWVFEYIWKFLVRTVYKKGE